MKRKIILKKKPIIKQNDDVDIYIPPKDSYKHRLDKDHIVRFDFSPTFRKSDKHY